MVVAEKLVVIDLSKITGAAGKKIFAVTVDANNNVSPMIELK